MEHLKEIIKDYLTKDKTDYAILIDGEWGNGKTFYFKNTLIPFIKSVKRQGSKNYSVIYLSLNGISNTDQIFEQILSNLLNLNSKKKVATNILVGVLKNSTSFISKKLLDLDISKVFNVKPSELFAMGDFSDKVFCFDDLERISPKVDIEEIFGFINTNFVEHNNLKTIVICNSQEIKKFEEIKRLREKIFKREIKFVLKIGEIYSNIISNYKNKGRYYKTLLKSEGLFLFLINRFELHNLRTINFILDTLEKIYENTKKTLWQEFSESLIYFVFVIGFEFKKGSLPNLSDLELKRLENTIENRIFYGGQKELGDEESTKEKDYYTYFYEKYIKQLGTSYIFFYSIYNYITKGFFDKKNYQTELTSNLPSKVKALTNKIINYKTLSDKEFNSVESELLAEIENGNVNLYSYPYLFHEYYNFSKDGIIKLDIEDLKDKFNFGLNLSAQKSEYNEEALVHTPLDDYGLPEIKEMTEKVYKFQNNFLAEKTKNKVLKIIEAFKSDNDEFYKISSEYYNISIFKYINYENLFRTIMGSSNKSITYFIRFLSQKYKYEEFKFSDDLEDLKQLRNRLKETAENKNNNFEPLKKHLMEELSKQIKTIIDEMGTKISLQAHVS